MPKAREPEKRSYAWIGWLILGVVAFLFVALPVIFMMAVFLSFASVSDSADFVSGNVAVIEIRGPIMRDWGTSSFGEAVTSSEDVVGFIEEIDKDSSIKAIVIDINSPGGSAVASDEIAQALKRTNKTTVSIIHEVGASGAYWIASATDTIIANRMSITGSIGVIASYLEFSDLFDKYGIEYQRMVAGKYKDMGSPFKNLTSEERVILQKKLDKLHNEFIDEVARNRGLSRETTRRLATGEFFLGSEAQELGLVDIVGDEKTLESYLKEKLGVEEIEPVFYGREPTFLDLLSGVMGENFFAMGRGIGTAVTDKAGSQGIQT